jgi:phage baseplate assembly protein W
MARPIYRLEPFNTTPNVAIGIKLPFNKPASAFSEFSNYASGSSDGGSVFVQSYTTLEQVVSNIKSLLLTRKGERFMQPNLGTDVFDTLFENLTNQTLSVLEQSIKNDFRYWLPYATLNNVLVSENRDLARLHIKFDVSVTTLGANIIINVLLDEEAILQIDTEETAIAGTAQQSFQLVPISSAPVTSPGAY